MSTRILVIATVEGADSFARVLGEQIGAEVEVVTSRRAGLMALRRQDYLVVVVEQNMAEADPEWADMVWQHAGLAIPLQVNFAISGSARLAREVRSAMQRRDVEQAIARKAVAAEMQNELKSSVTGLLLESELALRDLSRRDGPSMPQTLEPKLRHLVELAGDLRERLRIAAA